MDASIKRDIDAVRAELPIVIQELGQHDGGADLRRRQFIVQRVNFLMAQVDQLTQELEQRLTPAPTGPNLAKRVAELESEVLGLREQNATLQAQLVEALDTMATAAQQYESPVEPEEPPPAKPINKRR